MSAYALTLTREERKAIDWIGHRYAHGDELWRTLWSGCDKAEPDSAEWDDPCDITFHLSEHVAWEVRELLLEDNMACFAIALRDKLNEFIASIV